MPLIEESRATRLRGGFALRTGRAQRDAMRLIGILALLAASFCYAQDNGDFKPATSNVLDAQYPKVDDNSRVQIRFSIKHVFYEPPGTNHEWQTWRRDLKDFAPRLFQPAVQ